MFLLKLRFLKVSPQMFYRYCFLLLIFLVSLLKPIQGFALDFSEAYAKLLDQNLTYRRAQLDLAADRTLVAQARANLLPNVSANASTGYIRNDVSNLEDPSIDPLAVNDEQEIDFNGETRRRDEYGVRLTQPIYNRSLSIRLRQAKSRTLESELRLQRVLDEQLLSLADAYLGFQQAKISMDISQRELKSINDHRLLTKERQQIGLGTKSDALEALSRYKIAQVDFLEDQKRIEFYRKRLQRLLRVEQSVFTSKELNNDQFSQTTPKAGVDDLIKANIEQNIEVRLQQHVVKSAKLAVKLDRADGGPTLNLTASSRRSKTEAFEVGDEDERRDDRVLLELNVPLFAGFGQNAKVRESKLRFQAEQLELQNIIETQSERIQEAYRSRATAFQKMQSFKEAFIGSDQALALREEGYLEGLVDGLDVLNAFRDKHRSERSWRQAQFEYLLESLRLKIALGQATAKDVAFIDDYFLTKELGDQAASDKETTKVWSKKPEEFSLRQQKEQTIRNFIRQWEYAWEGGDAEKYLSFYAESFQPQGDVSLENWQSQRKQRVIPEKNITLTLSDVDIHFLEKESQYRIEFKQSYFADNFSDHSKKTLFIQAADSDYKIVSEYSSAL